ncbi:hypothetical protein UPYG_G00233960 [Umbra pygmaea]|uniref:Kinesin-like protein KIF6/9 C-terminal domain-containing protein n=1 Tax=Umbra pygmaea TaxID=75934 RepID=A0ABD0WFL5_UMBPY
MEDEKKSYKSIFGHLKSLKTEIEHLQLLLERSKMKLQRDFQDWWNQETARIQVPNLRVIEVQRGQISKQISESSSPSQFVTREPALSSAIQEFAAIGDNKGSTPTAGDLRNFVPNHPVANQIVPSSLHPPADDRDSASGPSAELRALSSTELSKSSIPLTGDQQTDADILAFIRARHNLLNMTGTVLLHYYSIVFRY